MVKVSSLLSELEFSAIFEKKKHDVFFHQKTHTTAALQIQRKQTESDDFAEKKQQNVVAFFRVILSSAFAPFRCCL